jgi:sn-glycerol 3-phosphate transport system permease protein
MVERRPMATAITHAVLVLGVLVVAFPVYLALVASTHTAQTVLGRVPLWFGPRLVENYGHILNVGMGSGSAPLSVLLFNSLVMAVAIAVGKIAISILSAYAIVYFRFPLRMVFFWMIFLTLMLPVEVRIMPTFKVVADLGLLNSYLGFTVPLIASATATFLFRQFFLTVPDELLEAARIDGAGPLRFFAHILVPLSRTNIAALLVILFIYGWNQYLWPLMLTTQEGMYTIVMGLKRMVPTGDAAVAEWNLVMAAVVLAMLPPVAVVVLAQRWFIKGLIETEK